MKSDHLNNTTWDNSKIYSDLKDPKLLSDIENAKSTIGTLKTQCAPFAQWIEKMEEGITLPLDLLGKATENKRMALDLFTTLWSAKTYVYSELSTNALNETAKEVEGKLSALFDEFTLAVQPLNVFLTKAPESFVDDYLKDPRVSETHFQLRHQRKVEEFSLSLAEEKLASSLESSGLHAWGKLYNAICGSMKITLDGEEMGFAKASGLLRQGDRTKREAAYKAINKAWTTHQESAAAILNGINGQRLEMNKARSQKKELHYLDVSCHESRITRNTLNTLMETTYKKREIGHRALKAMAKLMDLKTLAPWDTLAPAPLKSSSNAIPLDEAITLISDAFSKLSPEMGEFAQMMHKNNWIDSLPTEARGPGAYCTKFASVREPRVFMTYTGTMGNVITLAHELGHAYHNWVMKDLPLTEASYSMTLAETASIFAETLVKKSLLEKCESREEKLNILWQDAESAAALLINIPTRFSFEESLVEARKERPQSSTEMKALMTQAWKKWYGDTVSEYDDMFWASKMHFSISSIGFYNYPYLFGYLFSLGIYGQKDKFDSTEEFNKLYLNILKDTGTMMAEDLIKKHLGQDIEQEQFWLDSLSIVEEQISAFEELL